MFGISIEETFKFWTKSLDFAENPKLFLEWNLIFSSTLSSSFSSSKMTGVASSGAGDGTGSRVWLLLPLADESAWTSVGCSTLSAAGAAADDRVGIKCRKKNVKNDKIITKSTDICMKCVKKHPENAISNPDTDLVHFVV